MVLLVLAALVALLDRWAGPVVALAGGVLGVVAADAGSTRVAVALAVAAVLAVGPLADRLWYD